MNCTSARWDFAVFVHLCALHPLHSCTSHPCSFPFAFTRDEASCMHKLNDIIFEVVDISALLGVAVVRICVRSFGAWLWILPASGKEE